MRTTRTLAAAVTLLAIAGTAQADADAGKALHEKNCTKCHGPEVYTRDKRMVNSPAQLSAQVTRCQISLGLNWFDDDVANVAEYLNSNYYHFKE